MLSRTFATSGATMVAVVALALLLKVTPSDLMPTKQKVGDDGLP